MPETTTERLAALLGVLATITLLVLALSHRTERAAVQAAAPAAADGVSSAPVTSTEEPVARVASRPATRPQASATEAVLLVRAARGDCWLSIRRDAPTGDVLYEGVLASGRSVTVKGPRLWLRLGAASNVDLVLNGKRVAALAAGTFDVVATPRGVAPSA